MRAIRSLTVAALIALDVSAAAAQSTRHFEESWFWGAKGGIMSYQVQSSPNSLAPTGGIDWLITRKKGGLYAAFDHAFFSRDSVFVNDSVSPLDTVPRAVMLSGMRRFTLAGMLFPYDGTRVHPYFGLGVALSSVANVEPRGTFRNAAHQNLVLSTIAQFKTVASPVVIVGSQLRLFWVSAFAQATASPTYNNFFLFDPENVWRTSVEVGFRYNVGSSVERMR